ncbi:peptide/nickel transport system ATP-binding protein/oligopeptide transport system ATP-binding protein [Sinobacterium caligoides]|uniref:Peptide/nickel transport system ATP-binding protein/oligopeptide transport system ATP-binding protein n=1 Tax=Sinobacterium caligoides TaxID=933926 RepID=A0A3N2DNS6_9GAMM|nr:oligopeptide/dipeptide ABC transporter ATP-binding protein [Sinobacterium caligoides]ROS01468.1 peptide/nickel transport system ATP-binding protein/oligopeptide transport system ATP-binding protein [Sinobacterium caligoides]
MNQQAEKLATTEQREVILETRALETHFNIGGGRMVHAVDGMDIEIYKGEVVGLVGESGSGKSTLGKTLVGLTPKTAGEALFQGQMLPAKYTGNDYKRFSQQIQMIFQDPYTSLNPRMTIFDIIREPLMLQGEGRRDIAKDRELVASWLEKVGLKADHMSRYPHEFSGGQRQRVGIARALIVEPEFVVCDEPISALDVSVQAQVVNLLGELKDSMDLTLLFIAHDLSMVRYISDRIIVMYMGAMVEEGPADELFFNPQHPYTQLLVSSNPVADPKREREFEHDAIIGEVSSPINVKPGCRFAKRCPKVMPQCEDQTPTLVAVDNRRIACHLFD